MGLSDSDVFLELQKGFYQQEKAFLLFHYNRLVGTPPINESCGQCWQDAYYILRAHLKTNLMADTKRKYRILWHDSWLEGKMLSGDATDAQIDLLFASNPDLAKMYYEPNTTQEAAIPAVSRKASYPKPE